MESVAGLDVGVKKSALCLVTRDAASMRPVCRHRTATDPSSIGTWLASHGVVRVGLEAERSRRGWPASLSIAASR